MAYQSVRIWQLRIGSMGAELEAPDYWERYASVLMHWEQLSALVEEHTGETVVDAIVEDR